jgi:hypothetical protein
MSIATLQGAADVEEDEIDSPGILVGMPIYSR